MLDKVDYTPRLQGEYKSKIRSAMKEEFGYKNDMMIPKLEKNCPEYRLWACRS